MFLLGKTKQNTESSSMCNEYLQNTPLSTVTAQIFDSGQSMTPKSSVGIAEVQLVL